MDDAGDEDADRELCACIAVLGRFEHIAKIIRNAGDAEKAAVLLHALLNLLIGQALLAEEIHHAGVDIPDAVRVDQTGLEAHAETRIDAFAVFDRADRTAATEVAGDRGIILALAFVQHVCDIPVRRAVIAEPLHAEPFIPIIRHAEQLALQGNLPMERRFKAADKQRIG